MSDLTTLFAEALAAYQAVCAIETKLEQHYAASGDFNGLGHFWRYEQSREVGEWYRWRLTGEAAVRPVSVECPVLGDLPRQRCLEHQSRRSQFAATNPTRILLYRVCPTCIHRLGEKS